MNFITGLRRQAMSHGSGKKEKTMNPFRNHKPNPKRHEPRRVKDVTRLHGSEKTELRRQAFERSGGFCELKLVPECEGEITWESMELSHNEHGHRKSDTLNDVKAGCRPCHQVGKHNPKPCPRAPGRPMKRQTAIEYLKSLTCSCGKSKKQWRPFCDECWNLLSPQSQNDLERLDKRDWLIAMADAEKELLEVYASQKAGAA